MMVAGQSLSQPLVLEENGECLELLEKNYMTSKGLSKMRRVCLRSPRVRTQTFVLELNIATNYIALPFTETMNPIVIGLTEIWLKMNDMARMFRLKGYHNLIARNRDWSNRRGVGF